MRWAAPVLMLLVLLPRPAAADPLTSAPYLGPEKYTIHASGPLDKIAADLAKLAGRQFDFQGTSPAHPKSFMTAPVKLDFDDATLQQILLSACEQAGAAFEVAPEYGPGTIYLKPGDVRLDPRPTALFDDYIVRVIDVVASPRGGTEQLFWGIDPPQIAHRGHGVSLRMELIVRTWRGLLHLKQIDPRWVAEPDHGPALIWDPNRYAGASPQRIEGYEGFEPPTIPSRFGPSFPGLSLEATKIDRLCGTLLLYTDAEATEVRLDAGAVGKAFTSDDVTATLTQWKPDREDVRVVIAAHVPPFASKPFGLGDGVVVRLVGKDGRHSTDYWPFPQMTGGRAIVHARLSLTADVPPGTPWKLKTALVPDHLVVTFVRRGTRTEKLPVVIKDIPLPWRTA